MRRILSVLLLFAAVTFAHADAKPGDPIRSPSARPRRRSRR